MPLFGLLFCYLAGFDVTFGTETICDGQANQRTTSSVYGCYPRQGYQAGNDSQEVSVFERIQVQAEPSPFARSSRYRVAEVSDGYLCQWLFLARA